MTLSTTASRVSYAANGSTTTFAFAFKIWAAANLKVYLRNNTTLADTLQTQGVDYTIDITAYPNTGNVVFTTAPPSGRTVVIVRDMPLTQDLDLIATGSFAAENVEAQLDKLAAEIQTLRELIARSPRVPVGTALSDLALPEPQPAVANQLLGITAAGDGFELKSPVNLQTQTVSSYIATLLDDPDAPTARATLGIGSAVDLSLLQTDNSGMVAGDLVPFVDISEGNASNKVSLQIMGLSMILAGTAAVPTGVGSDYQVLTRRLTDGLDYKVKLSDIGIGKQTIWVPASAMIPRVTNGPSTGTVETSGNNVMIKTLDFDPATWEFAQFSVQMPKGWNEGSMTAVFVWSHATASANFAVTWGIQGSAYSDGDLLDVAFGSAAMVSDTGGVTNVLYRSPESNPFAFGSALENDVVLFQVQRAGGDPTDTLPIDARLHGVALYYTTNANTDN